MKKKWPNGLFAEMLRKQSYLHLEQQIALFPILAIPVMFNHLGANRPFEALRVLKQVGDRIGTAHGLPHETLAFVFKDVLPCVRAHDDWQEKLRGTLATLPRAALALFREHLPGSANADMMEFLPALSAAERKRLH